MQPNSPNTSPVFPDQWVLNQFGITSSSCEVQIIPRGHLNRTFVVTNAQSGAGILLQRINEVVFADIDGLMSNVAKVCKFLQAEPEYYRHATPLLLVPTCDGALYVRDDHGGFWRAYSYLAEREVFEQCPSVAVAMAAGRLCGRFTAAIAALPCEAFAVPLPHFQDLSRRFVALADAMSMDVSHRLSAIESEVAYLACRAPEVVGVTDSKVLPVRICHNDFKLNNLLFRRVVSADGRDEIIGDAVVDLDTCMPGTLPYDFGDMVRSLALSRPEDEPDLDRVVVDPTIVAAGIEGFLETCGHMITPEERVQCDRAPVALALTLAARFYTDYLSGDKYFAVSDPEQNLRRARVYVQLAERLRH